MLGRDFTVMTAMTVMLEKQAAFFAVTMEKVLVMCCYHGNVQYEFHKSERFLDQVARQLFFL